MSEIRLTKSLYLASRQCNRRLWLEVNAPEFGRAPDEAERFILEQGSEVGRAAHHLFPLGVAVAAEGGGLPPVEATRELMATQAVGAIFEATFEYQNVEVRVDILERLPRGRWGLREVKSSTSLKEDQHLPDLRFRSGCLRGVGSNWIQSN